MFLVQFWNNMHSWVFQWRQIALMQFWRHWKTYSCMLFLTCNRNHAIMLLPILTAYQHGKCFVFFQWRCKTRAGQRLWRPWCAWCAHLLPLRISYSTKSKMAAGFQRVLFHWTVVVHIMTWDNDARLDRIENEHSCLRTRARSVAQNKIQW